MLRIRRVNSRHVVCIMYIQLSQVVSIKVCDVPPQAVEGTAECPPLIPLLISKSQMCFLGFRYSHQYNYKQVVVVHLEYGAQQYHLP